MNDEEDDGFIAMNGFETEDAPPASSTEHEGFTQSELETALKVLETFKGRPERVNDPRYNDLRRAASVFLQTVTGRVFSGMDKRDYETKKARQRERNQRDCRLKALDQKKINTSRLRQERLESLSTLLSSQPAMPLLEDAQHVVKQLTDAPADEKLAEVAASSVAGERDLLHPRSCYICKNWFTQLHEFYDALCPTCAELNWEKRNARVDLRGKVVLVTGGRIKIGYECGRRLLQCGAEVIITTRFPHDCVLRYSKETDFEEWKTRLHVFGLDMRDLRSVSRLAARITERFPRLDAIINNAAQTVRRPPAYYRHLLTTETKLPDRLAGIVEDDPHVRLSSSGYLTYTTDEAATSASASAGAPPPASAPVTTTILTDGIANTSVALSQLPVLPGDDVHDEREFPQGLVDVNGQQLDLRTVNSWQLRLHQIDPTELIEVHAINSLAPFILNSQLKDLMMRDPTVDKYIVNVSAMEGKFYRHKSANHPHTNMAKASMNMMTRTSAQDYAKDRIYMTSVDTGWINDENPFQVAQEILKTNFQTPIDEMDAMARILDPVFVGFAQGINNQGIFFKDFVPTEW